MIGGFRTDNEALAERAGAFARLSEQADRIVADLTDQFSVHGECWGGDAAGQSFAECHVEPASAVLQSISSLPNDLLDIGSRLSATAVTYAESELDSGDAVRIAGRGLEDA